MRGNKVKGERLCWSLELYLNQRRHGLIPIDLYDYPYGVVKEYLFLMDEAPKTENMITESDNAMEKAEAKQNA